MVKRRSPGEMFAFKVSEGSPCLASSSTNKPQRFWEDKNSPATVSLTPKNERQHERRVEIILRGLKRVVVSLQRQRKKDHHLLKEMRSCFICWTVAFLWSNGKFASASLRSWHSGYATKIFNSCQFFGSGPVENRFVLRLRFTLRIVYSERFGVMLPLNVKIQLLPSWLVCWHFGFSLVTKVSFE